MSAHVPGASRMRSWRLAQGLSLACAALVVGCGEDGPKGPGTFHATITGPTPLGAVVVEVGGVGIQGFSPSGSEQLFWAETSPSTYRIVIVGEVTGELGFDVEVADVGVAAPATLVVQATDAQNDVVLLLGEVRVRFN